MKTNNAYDAIKDLLLNHQLSPGQSIVYRYLEEKLKMSRTPIINALARLEQEGFVISKENCGYYVAESTIDDVVELFDIRVKLEVLSLDFAIETLKDPAQKMLNEKRLQDIEKSFKEYNTYKAHYYDRKRLDLDIKFHISIIELGGKKYYTKLMKNFYEILFFKINPAQLSHRVPQYMKEHALLYEAIKSKDLQKAKKIQMMHTTSVKKIILEQV